MFSPSEIIDIEPYSLAHAPKEALHLHALLDLTRHHYEHCPPYRRILDLLGCDLGALSRVEDIPFIPVRLFKKYELLSVERRAVVKTMTSSGTTGQSFSKIFLDKDTSTFQTKVLTKLVSTFIGKKRLPMLVIDSRSVVQDRNLFSARGAGILGFSMFGREVEYALDDQMQLDIQKVHKFLEKHQCEPILLFGFTFVIWAHFYEALKKAGVRLPLDHGILIHGGGWKKLMDQAVDGATFKRALREVAGIGKIYNYYGMVEQTGSIFMECETGHLHSSIFSDIFIRDHRDFKNLPTGQAGLVQLVSLLPLSYPGHSILSEDLGVILGEDDCSCGRMGKYFEIRGRIKNAEVRGCSDTYAASA